MNVAQFCTGMIFTLPDQILSDKVEKDRGKRFTHPYIVLGIKQRKMGDEGKRYFIQTMGITSLTNKVKTDEIPIVMSNSTIGYISTSNIYSFDTETLDMYNFKGMIIDNDFMSRDEFVRFLTDMWKVNNGLSTEEEESKTLDVLKDYNVYFQETNASIPEFRHVKSETNVSLAIAKAIAKAEAEAATTSESESNTENTEIVVTDIPDIMEAKKINNFAHKLQAWTNDEIELFIKLSESYSYKELSRYMTRYVGNNNYTRALMQVKNIAIERKLSVVEEEAENSSNKCIPIKPITKYSDTELMDAFKYLNKNFKNKNECIRYIKGCNEKELTTFIAKLKMEMRRRKMIV